ncbi:MAG: ABC transporter permease [Deltaproteobacteria bacterium]|jgi:lipoprotein-releasing system permease protein|nr:ABC transporter permease [Deltaproteobacteria bacterium]
MGFQREIAIRFLRAKKRRSLLSLISVLAVGGVGLGVAALIVVLAVLAGFETNLKNKLLGLSAHVTVYRGSYIEGESPPWTETAATILSVKGVNSALPFINGQAMVGTGRGANGVMVLGIDPKLARSSGYFDNLNLSPLAELNLTQRPMESPWADTEWWAYTGGLFPEKNDQEEDSQGQTDQGEYSQGEDGQGETDGAASQAPTPPKQQRPIIVGHDLANILGVETLGKVNVISPFGRITPLGNRGPLNRVFTVAGTFRVNYYDFDSRVVYTTLEEAASLLGMSPGEITYIEVYVDDIYQAKDIKLEILRLLGYTDYYAVDWMDRNMSLFSALKLEQTAMFVILTLIILVAAFNIASTLIMMVTEKTRDIAILKAMGASSSAIRRIFTIQGLLVGGVGTFGGLIVGVGLCLALKRYEFISLPSEIYLMNTLPVEMRLDQILSITFVSLLISYLATVYPASQAAKLDPVEALRYE